MFAALSDKVKWAFGVESEHVTPDNATVDHDGGAAATISATSNAWNAAKDKAANIQDGIAQSFVSHFGNIAYCIKGAEDKNSTANTWADIKAGADATLKDSKDVVESFIGSGFEAATDEFVNAKILDDADAHGSGFKAGTDDATSNAWIDIKEAFVGSGFEAATDEFVSVIAVEKVVFSHDVPANKNIESSGPEGTKSVINGGLNDSSHTYTSEKVGNFDD